MHGLPTFITALHRKDTPRIQRFSAFFYLNRYIYALILRLQSA
jgi:hypothetical protein